MKILLIVGGSIAAYKACELIRLCRKAGIEVKMRAHRGRRSISSPR